MTNNHSFCMSLNSNVFIGKYGLPVTERARLLGHSVGTNLRYYSFAGKDSLDDICAILNGEIEVSPGSHQNIITFTNEKTQEPHILELFRTKDECGRWDLNPHERNAHKILSLARLPIPTLPHSDTK